ncbi:ParB/RepB/Spo0J family partition protein [Burkholderia gladioli]|uniref:ParB/RepB/Spo0J family partition protein n=1 Tax=Burkholderia gladioli TaxID=28095 RepID=UPI001640A0C1|nr:hypothetical protein [Burkholderia gladioli]
MGRSSKEVYGSKGSRNLLDMDPESFTLVTDPKHFLYDRRVHQAPNEKTIRNYRVEGVKEPILFYRDVETGKFLVVDGRGRVINARELNRRLIDEGKEPITIPAIALTVPKAGAQKFVGSMISMNEHRVEDSLVNRAEKMANAREVGYSVEMIAVLFGVEPATVTASMKLLDCCMAVRDAVEDGTITQAIAMMLSKLTPDEQRAKLEAIKAAIEGKTGHERSRAMRGAMQDAAPARRARPKRAEIVEALKTATGERAEALRWVLGLADGEQAPETDPRQTTIDDAIAAN